MAGVHRVHRVRGNSLRRPQVRDARFEATYAERAEAIQGGMEKAEKAQEAAEAALQEYQAQLADARTEAAKIREDAKTQGTQIIAEMRAAQAEAARIKTSAEANLEAERNQLMTALRGARNGGLGDHPGRTHRRRVPWRTTSESETYRRPFPR